MKRGEALPVFKPEEFTPRSLRDLARPPVFMVQGVPNIELSEVEFIESREGGAIPTKQSNWILLRAGLVGWRDLYRDGEPLEWSKDIDANIRALHLSTIAALAVRIWNLSTLTDEEKKISESPQTSPQREPSSTASIAPGGDIATKQTRRRTETTGK